jgi:hypothetical protein
MGGPRDRDCHVCPPDPHTVHSRALCVYVCMQSHAFTSSDSERTVLRFCTLSRMKKQEHARDEEDEMKKQ